MKQSNKIIGRTAIIDVDSIENVPAKIDTGADSSSIWASDIKLHNGELSFVLFGSNSPFYTGKRITKSAGHYTFVKVASSSGVRQIRYVVVLPATINSESHKIRFTLSDRSTMLYPVLIGQHFLDNRFLIDTTQNLPANVQVELNQAKSERLGSIKRGESRA
jgi:hypothetical protein